MSCPLGATAARPWTAWLTSSWDSKDSVMRESQLRGEAPTQAVLGVVTPDYLTLPPRVCFVSTDMSRGPGWTRGPGLTLLWLSSVMATCIPWLHLCYLREISAGFILPCGQHSWPHTRESPWQSAWRSCLWKVISSLGSNHGNRAMSSYNLCEDEVPQCPSPELPLTLQPCKLPFLGSSKKGGRGPLLGRYPDPSSIPTNLQPLLPTRGYFNILK